MIRATQTRRWCPEMTISQSMCWVTFDACVSSIVDDVYFFKKCNLKIKVDSVPGVVIVVVGWGEVLVPEVLAEEVDQDKVDDREERAEEDEEQE